MIKSFLNDFIDACQYVKTPEACFPNYFAVQWHNYCYEQNECLRWQKFHLLWLLPLTLTLPTHFQCMPHVWWFISKLIKRKNMASSPEWWREIKEMNESSTERLNLWGHRELSFPQRQLSFFVLLFLALDYRIRVLGSLIPLFMACVSRSCEFQVWSLRCVRQTNGECQLFSHLKLFLISYQPRWDLFVFKFSHPLSLAYTLNWLSNDDDAKSSRAFPDSIWLRTSHVPSGSHDKMISYLESPDSRWNISFFAFSRYTIKYDLFLG